MFCKIDIPEQRRTVTRIDTIEHYEIIQSQVVCEKHLNISLLQMIEERLLEERYISGLTGSIIADLRAIVEKQILEYQKQNNLPVCFLNLETLKHLGIEMH